MSIFKSLVRAAVGVATLPVSVAADVVTLGGALTDGQNGGETFTGRNVRRVVKNLEKAAK